MDREAIVELFSSFGPVSIRRMFSGFGLYADDVCFSLFLRGELYLKADETTAPRFADEGSSPFSYAQRRSGTVVTVNSYWRLPERLYDDPDELAEWARAAVTAAHRHKLGKSARKRKWHASTGSSASTRRPKKTLNPSGRTDRRQRAKKPAQKQLKSRKRR
jgi:DNA transformation protein